MDRLDLYSMVHKGIRAELFRVAVEVARTDFADHDDVESTVRRVRALLSYLDEHAEHEDRVILPELIETAPGVCSELHADHLRLEALHHEVGSILDGLDTSPAHEAISRGRRLHERIGRLVAEHLLHMNREESAGNRALWAHHTDAELTELHQRIVSGIAPQRMAEWMDLILPTLNPAERAQMQAAAGPAN